VTSDEAVAGDDGKLLVAARAGDRAALESLLRRHYDRCYAVCRRLLGNDEDALDATQETMIAVARGVAGFDGRSALSTWIYRVATNAALDELRRRQRRPIVERVPASSELGSRIDDMPASTCTDEVGERVSARVSLDRALRQLSDEHRAAVVLRDVFDLDYAEIADVLGVPIGTVRSRIARGRAALTHALEPQTPPRIGRRVIGSQRNRSGLGTVEGS